VNFYVGSISHLCLTHSLNFAAILNKNDGASRRLKSVVDYVNVTGGNDVIMLWHFPLISELRRLATSQDDDGGRPIADIHFHLSTVPFRIDDSRLPFNYTT